MSRSRILRDTRRQRRASVRACLQPRLTAPLLAVWRLACCIFLDVATIVMSPRELAARDYISRAEHGRLADLVRHLEQLAHRIVLAAALTLNIILRPLGPRPPRPHARRRVLVWPDRPESWITRQHFIRAPREPSGWRYPRRAPSVVVDSFPLARRFEGVRRILVAPDMYVRRLALRLARIAERNPAANEPFTLGVRDTRQPGRPASPGARWVAEAMDQVRPILASPLDRWNDAIDPG